MTPFVLVYRAVEDDEVDRPKEQRDDHPERVRVRGTNGNDLLGLAGLSDLVRLLLARGTDQNRGNDYGWTKLQPGWLGEQP